MTHYEQGGLTQAADRLINQRRRHLTRLSLIKEYAETSIIPPGVSVNIGCKATTLGDVKLDIAGQPDVKGSVLSLPFRPGTFSVAIFSEVLEHLPRGTEPRAIKEIYGVLGDSGVLILSTPSSDGAWGKLYSLSDPAFWLIGHRHYSGARIRHLLRAGGFFVESLTRRGGTRELVFSVITPLAYALKKLGASWNPHLESNYSLDRPGKGYTLIALARKQRYREEAPSSSLR